jgi:ubiquitin-activating enzyme E1
MKKSANYESCITLAKETFNEYYDHSIRNLLSLFPVDHKDKDGAPFWSGPKRAPHPLTFSVDDPSHLEFVYSFANLIAFNLNIT